jgi:hypothetical protein
MVPPTAEVGLISPPFGKWFGMLTILSLSKEGGREGFSKR